jgi:chaperonin GroEL
MGRTVAIGPSLKTNSGPEILTDAGTIARRVLELPDRCVDPGAMLIRSLAWDMRDKVGDGSATAAVLARAMVRAGARMVAAGANPVLMRRGMEQGLRAAVASLGDMAQPLDSQGATAALARAATGDLALADLIAEIFDIVGVEGTIVVEKYVATVMEREYVEGVRWDNGLVSTQFVTDVARQEAVMTNPVIALADLDVTSTAQVMPLLNQALRCGAESLVLIAPKVEGQALATLLLNKSKLPTVAIRAPGFTLNRSEIMKDLAVLTGATVIDPGAGRWMEDFQAEYFGGARRVIATRRKFTIVGARGSQKEIRRRSAELRARLVRQEPEDRSTMQRRLANLAGGVAILKIGAISEKARDLKAQLAEDAIRSVQSALEEGVVPGGGAAYVTCIPAVEAVTRDTEHVDQAAGVRAVAEALAAPLQQIAVNAGYEGSTVAAQVRMAGSGFGFDALSGRVVNMEDAGILDPAKVLRLALQKAASVAATFLTTETMVLRRKPPMSHSIV